MPRELGQHTSASDIGAVEYTVGQNVNYTLNAAAMTANTIRWAHIIAPIVAHKITRLAVEQTVSATGNLRFFVATNMDNREGRGSNIEAFAPFEIVYDSGDISLTGTGIKSTGAISVVLDPGQTYWVGMVNDASVTVRNIQQYGMRGFGFTTNSNKYAFMTAPFTYGALAVGANPPIPTSPLVQGPAMRYMLGVV